MPPSRNQTGWYYYASGKRVELKVDENWVAIDQGKFTAAGTPARLQASIRKHSSPLRGDLFLVQRQAIPAKQLESLTHSGGIAPVFRSGGALLIALPEVRVEESTRERRRALLRWINDRAELAEIVEDDGEKILLRPGSGKGADAITLANQIIEQIGPELAQPRFLRVVEHYGAAL